MRRCYAGRLAGPIGGEHSLPSLTTVAAVRRYPEWFDNYGWLRERGQTIDGALQSLPRIVESLRSASRNVQLAARRLSLAALRDADDDRTVDACIGIEALLGEGRDELSHRLALRAATALATRPGNAADAMAVYDLVKKVYAHRSAVVHGTTADRSRTLQLGDQTYETAVVAVMLLRELLTDTLTRSEPWTPQSLDAALLSSLSPIDDLVEAGDDAVSANEDAESDA